MPVTDKNPAAPLTPTSPVDRLFPTLTPEQDKYLHSWEMGT